MDNLRMSEIRFNTKYHTEESPIKSNINLEYMNDIAKISTYSTDFVNDDYDTITNDTKYLANITKLVTVLYNISNGYATGSPRPPADVSRLPHCLQLARVLKVATHATVLRGFRRGESYSGC